MDVVTEIEIRRPRDEVAVFASDPDRATSWYRNIETVEWQSPKPLVVGSRIAFVARFLGRRLSGKDLEALKQILEGAQPT